MRKGDAGVHLQNEPELVKERATCRLRWEASDELGCDAGLRAGSLPCGFEQIEIQHQVVERGTIPSGRAWVRREDGRPKGSGIVVFENPDDARNAIAQFNGYDWQGRVIEVREDRYASSGPGMGFGGRGGYGGGMRGGFGGGFGGEETDLGEG